MRQEKSTRELKVQVSELPEEENEVAKAQEFRSPPRETGVKNTRHLCGLWGGERRRGGLGAGGEVCKRFLQEGW